MDNSLYYEDKGSGEYLILLHGNNSNSRYFRRQIEYFSRFYRIIAIDTRGHGKSPRGHGKYDIEQLSEDLKSFMDNHFIERAILLGFSDGANIAMKFSIKYQYRLKALILYSGNTNFLGMKKHFQIFIDFMSVFIDFFDKFFHRVKKYKELISLIKDDPRIPFNELNKIEVPTLVVSGTRDIVSREHTCEIARNIKNSRILFINGGHRVSKIKSKEFNYEIHKFLQSI